MITKTYKELLFWQSAKQVSLLIVALIKKFPNERVYWIIGDQVLRSSFSVGANIAEGFGKFKGNEYQRFITIALGSANETDYWLELVKDICPPLAREIDTAIAKNSETIKMLTATLKSLRNN
ncbi:MAG: four helix bundle protein [Patescibacteria group bacterium]|nr:four helix bundle protein [Patescibacteria group bacterium]